MLLEKKDSESGCACECICINMELNTGIEKKSRKDTCHTVFNGLPVGVDFEGRELR